MDILYSDKQLTLCVKPVGVLSEEGGMPELLKEETGAGHLCVHRLDRAVGGLMVYAKTPLAAGKLSAQIADRSFIKEYLAIVSGRPEDEKGVMRDLLFKDSAKNKGYVVKRMRKGVKEAELEYELLSSNETSSLVRILLKTGRSHQIRVQFSSRAMPLLGDVKYGSTEKGCNIALWSNRLCFRHPVSGALLDFSAPPPEEYPWNLFNSKEQ